MIDGLSRQFEMENSLQRQRIDADQAQSAAYMLNNQHEIQAALIEQITPRKVVEDIRMKLEGKRINSEGVLEEVSDPLMNKMGISKMIVLVESVVNINTIMSAFSDETKINSIMIDLMDKIIDDLTLNWKRYGIKSKADLDRIEGIIKYMSYPTLLRALYGGERRFLGKVTVENISNAPRPSEQKKDGFLSRFKL